MLGRNVHHFVDAPGQEMVLMESAAKENKIKAEREHISLCMCIRMSQVVIFVKNVKRALALDHLLNEGRSGMGCGSSSMVVYGKHGCIQRPFLQGNAYIVR